MTDKIEYGEDIAEVCPLIERRTVKRSAIQWLPFAGKLYRQYLPLFPIAVEQFDLDPYDLVISTSHCAAKAVVKTGRARHRAICSHVQASSRW